MRDDSALGLAAGSVADAALSGLLQPRKTLPAKLFYDELASCTLSGRSNWWLAWVRAGGISCWSC